MTFGDSLVQSLSHLQVKWVLVSAFLRVFEIISAFAISWLGWGPGLNHVGKLAFGYNSPLAHLASVERLSKVESTLSSPSLLYQLSECNILKPLSCHAGPQQFHSLFPLPGTFFIKRAHDLLYPLVTGSSATFSERPLSLPT